MYSVTLEEIEAYCDAHWDEVVADIESLVSIPSVESPAEATPNAPYGPGPRRALDEALSIARRMGLDAHDCEGRIGYADLPGKSAMQIGIIGHVDVVPAGPSWSVEPYGVTRRDGYLLGRGVIDDKGPLMVALHALRFWKDRADERGERLPYTVRVLFGANEETNMKDVAYYRERYEDPAFLFTPDSQFPVGYGESGICSGTLASAPTVGGHIVELEGGQAVNAVPGVATALVRSDAGLAGRGDVSVEPCGEGLFRLVAHGVSAHAMSPELGRNAIGLLGDYLLDAGVGTPEERSFLQLAKRLHDHHDGSGFGISCSDAHFGALSAVGGVIGIEGGRICQSIDFRYPTAITADRIEQQVRDVAGEYGADFTMQHDKEPFLMDPSSPAILALLDAYTQVTGEESKALTSKGGTYARCFTTGVSFGVEKPWVDDPEWVGGMHGPDEGVSEDLLREAYAVYALALGNLMQVELSGSAS